MLGNLRRKRSQISDTLYASVLTRLYAFSRKVLNLNLGKLRLGSQAHKSFRYFNQKGPFPYELCRENGVVFKMLECSTGTFEMGHKDVQDSQPRLEVIDASFLLGQTEVTQELYEAVMETNPSYYENRPQNPVEQVNWRSVIRFCNKLSELQGLDKCYVSKKTKIGILRSETPSEKKDLVKYDKFYEGIRSAIQNGIENACEDPSGIEFEIEYDPDVSTCDAIVTDREDGKKYSIEPDWQEKLDDKVLLNLRSHLGNTLYFLNKKIKVELTYFSRTLSRPIILCDFTKNGYRLPTEKEWEYAAKAGTKNKYAGTDIEAELTKYAVCYGNSPISTQPVATKLSNEWGFFDMSGNVWEWCWDKYNPKGSKLTADRVRRGGGYSWGGFSSCRRDQWSVYGGGDEGLGFRICRTLV